VASELCKRGYEVALTMGNHPRKDLLVVSPNQIAFGIDVKGLYRKNWWAIGPRPLRDDLFYVFAFVPDGADNRFFVLTQAQVNAEIAAASAASHTRAQKKGRVSSFDKFPGIGWRDAEKYDGKWEALPS
jgi:hypothetical protein